MPPTIIPHIPDGITNAKFIQFYVAKTRPGILTLPFLRVSFDYEYQHGDILRDSLDELKLPWEVSENENLAANKFPADLSSAYRLVGAGRFNYMGGEFLAWGASADYVVVPDAEHFKTLRKLSPNFRFRIDGARR